MSKPKVAFYWCASCGGCEEAVVDIGEDILKVVEAVDIVFWPVALDFKEDDLEKVDRLAVSFINGAVRSDDQERVVKLLREKSDIVVAFGTCACFGGVAGGLGNLYGGDSMLKRAFIETPSTVNPSGVMPSEKTDTPAGRLTLPPFHETANALRNVIEVDYYLPGCSVPKDLVMYAVSSILAGKLPAKGSYLMPPDIKGNLCDVCERKDTLPKNAELKIHEMKRPHQINIDTEKCFIAQGLLCMGMATNAGCGMERTGRCIRVNMPCRGCFGPTEANPDQGTAMLTALAAMLDTSDNEAVGRLVDSIVDPEGTLYRYTHLSIEGK
ncbi:MAG: oxidoreductase [Nitrospirota bacterium]|nr:oxidoreductase [Nitrospirota bacterium]